DGEGDGGGSATVSGVAHGLDQLGDVRLRIVVLDRRPAGRVVHGGIGHAPRAAQGVLHRGGARGAAHALDREDDPGPTHGICAAKRTAAGPTSPAPPPGVPSACSCRSGTEIRPPPPARTRRPSSGTPEAPCPSRRPRT